MLNKTSSDIAPPPPPPQRVADGGFPLILTYANPIQSQTPTNGANQNQPNNSHTTGTATRIQLKVSHNPTKKGVKHGRCTIGNCNIILKLLDVGASQWNLQTEV